LRGTHFGRAGGFQVAIWIFRPLTKKGTPAFAKRPFFDAMKAIHGPLEQGFSRGSKKGPRRDSSGPRPKSARREKESERRIISPACASLEKKNAKGQSHNHHAKVLKKFANRIMG